MNILLRAPAAAVLLVSGLGAQSQGTEKPGEAPPASRPSRPSRPQREPVTDLDACRKALARLAARYGETSSIRASYRQERTTALLKRPLVSRGSLLFRRDPACMVFRGAGTGATTIKMTYTTYEVYRPKRDALERTPLADKSLPDALFTVFTPGMERLEKTFTIDKAWRTGTRLEIRLRPKERTNDFLKDFAIVLDEKANELRRVEYRDPQDDRVALILGDLQLDPKLDADAFDLPVTKSTKVLVHPPLTPKPQPDPKKKNTAPGKRER